MDQKNSRPNDRNVYFIFSVTLIAVMGVASITPAFPTIIEYFHLSPTDIGLLITAFTIPGVILTPLMGILADRMGRKSILVPSLMVFGIAGTLCAFANSYHQLLVLRIVQGMGAASLGSINITLVGDLYSGPKRATIMGYNASVLSIGVATYPALGGMFTMMNWRYVFALPALAIPVALLVWQYMQTVPIIKPISGRSYFHNVWKTINRKPVWGLFFTNILVFIILYGSYLTFFPILLKNEYNASALIIGIAMSSMSLTTALFSSQMGKLNKRFQKKQLMFAGIIAYFISLILLSAPPGWALLVPAIIIFGLAHGLMIPTMQTVLVSMASVNERAAFMSINSMVLRTGQSLGPIFIGLFYINNSLSGVFMAGAGCAIIMFLLIALTFKPILDETN